MVSEFKLVTNPLKNAENKASTGDEKIQQMKKDQEARRASLFSEMEEYRGIYHAQQKKCAEAQSVFLVQQRELKRIDKNDSRYAEQRSKFDNAKKCYSHECFERDLKLSLLQYRSDNYVKASRLNILDLA